MRSRRLPLFAALAALVLPAAALGHELFDHAPPARSDTTPPSPVFQAGGQNAKWEALGTIATGNPHTDLDFFTRGGETFAAVGTLAAGANGGGVTFVKLLGKEGKVAPDYVFAHPSASCTSTGTTGLQHDIEVTPKPESVPLNTANSAAKLGDAQLVLDATDATGRCHDQGIAGVAQAPRGGLEIIDVSEGVDKAKEIGLTSHIGEAHTVNIDPKRPHIAYAVTSDSISVDDKGVRSNENETVNQAGQDTTSFALDGFEMVDLSSCMNFPAGTTLEQKRAACRPKVYRYRYPSAVFAQGHAADDAADPYRGIYACHELEVYADDRLTCASGAVSLVFDMKGAFDDNGTPADYTDDKPKGTPLPCNVRATSTQFPALKTTASITDCVNGMRGTTPVDLRVARWKKIGAPSLEGVQHIGTVQHIGRAGTGQRAKLDSTQDIDFSHEAELSHSGRYLIATDERGGGILPPGASCDAANGIAEGNGGVHFYDMSRLRTTFTGNAEEAAKSYARTAKGDKAIYRVPIRTGAQVTICTAHVFQQIPGQNRIFMAWYSQGTQVFDYVERPDGTLDLKEAGWFIPAAANEWTSAIFRVEKNADGTFTYYGAAGDFRLTESGRNAIDLYKVTLPAPPSPRIAGASVPAQQGPTTFPSSGPPACVAGAGLRNVAATRRGKGLRLAFTGAGKRAVDIDVFRVSRADRVLTAKRVARFQNRRTAFTWAAKGAANGVYVVRFRVRGNGGGALAQRVAVRRGGGRFSRLGPLERRATCDAVERLALDKPVFGGRSGRALRLVARLSKTGTVDVDLLRGGRVVRSTKPRAATPGTTVRIAIPSKGLARGGYAVRVTLRIGESTVDTVTLRAQRL
jgi:hypothetical protein